ncbi:zinc finger protein 16-like isoform X2 [Patiria miniata]|uniref:C2H2-type domain-containing protein n=1 Tax=Patiria miniata TaxID=46514 RepID=A0A914B8D5_PATMI|nr:zinc finger protein 16-like isoform X2 [Patiria miniata]
MQMEVSSNQRRPAEREADKQPQCPKEEIDVQVKEEVFPNLSDKIQAFLPPCPQVMERWGTLRDQMLDTADLQKYAAKIVGVDSWSSDEAFASYLLDCLEEDLAHGDEIIPDEDEETKAESLEVQLLFPHLGAKWERLRDRLLSIPYVNRYAIQHPGWSGDQLVSCCLLDRLEEQLENTKQEEEEERQVDGDVDEAEEILNDDVDDDAAVNDPADDDDVDDGDDGHDDDKNEVEEDSEEDDIAMTDDPNDLDYCPTAVPKRKAKAATTTLTSDTSISAENPEPKQEAGKKIHSQPNVRVYICNICNWHADSKTTAKQHYKEVHWDPGTGPNGKKKNLPTAAKEVATMYWHCLECEANVEDLREHKRECPGVTCEVCGKTCLKRSILRAHTKKRHTLNRSELKNQLCHLCGRLFYSRTDLNLHIQGHLGVKKYICQECGKAFSMPINLSRHKVIHMKEKPFECSYCGQRFSQKYNMKKHTRLHTGLKPYECELCSEAFNHNVSLKNHKKKAHGIDWWQKHKLPADHPFSKHVARNK